MTALLLAISTEEGFARDLLIVLATAGLVAMVMQRLRLAVVPAYLIAGAIIGPSSLAFVSSPESMRSISDLAIILLMFGIGLHMQLDALKGSAAALLTAGAVSTVVTTLLMWPVSLAFGASAPGALAIAMAFSISSTAVVLRLLSERRDLGTPSGRMSLAILVVQDLMVLPMLALMPALAAWASGSMIGAGAAGGRAMSPEGDAWMDFVGDAGMKIGGVAALIVFGRAVLPRLLAEAARGRSGEVMMVLSLASAIGAAALTRWLGFSAELGAFLAGFLLSATPFRFQLSGQIGPLRDLFMAVFFTTVGMSVDPRTAAADWWMVLLGGAAMLVVKSVGIGATCWAVGATASTSVRVGLSLAQAGEFSLVMLPIAQSQGLIDSDRTTRCITVVVLSLILTPTLVQTARRIAPLALRVKPAPWTPRSRLRDDREAAVRAGAEGRGGEGAGASPGQVEGESSAGRAAPGDWTMIASASGSQAGAAAAKPGARKRVIVAGFGPVGRAVAEKLSEAGVDYTIVELNTATVRTQERLGRKIVYGDISSPDVLDSAGLHEADAVVLTIPDEDATLRACQTIRKLAPRVYIAARVDFLSQGMLAKGLGADYVIVDELATAEAMRVAVLDRLGFKVEKTVEQAMRASVSLRRTEGRKRE